MLHSPAICVGHIPGECSSRVIAISLACPNRMWKNLRPTLCLLSLTNLRDSGNTQKTQQRDSEMSTEQSNSGRPDTILSSSSRRVAKHVRRDLRSTFHHPSGHCRDDRHTLHTVSRLLSSWRSRIVVGGSQEGHRRHPHGLIADRRAPARS